VSDNSRFSLPKASGWQLAIRQATTSKSGMSSPDNRSAHLKVRSMVSSALIFHQMGRNWFFSPIVMNSRFGVLKKDGRLIPLLAAMATPFAQLFLAEADFWLLPVRTRVRQSRPCSLTSSPHQSIRDLADDCC